MAHKKIQIFIIDLGLTIKTYLRTTESAFVQTSLTLNYYNS